MANKEDEADLPAPTTAASGQIKAIAKETVHKICSGQVTWIGALLFTFPKLYF